MAVINLRDAIPEFAATFEERLNFFATGADGISLVASKRAGKWKVKAKQMGANSLVMDVEEAEPYLRKTLKKHGIPEVEIERYARQFQTSPEGQTLLLPTGETFVKNGVVVQIPELKGQFLDDRLAVLIAFEFLSLCLGPVIMGSSFDAIRDYICDGTRTNQCQVLNKRAREYRPRHSIRFQLRDDNVTAFIEFFGWYVFEVSFRDIHPPAHELVYIEDLQNKQALMALSPEDAKRGNWIVLQESPAVSM